MRWLLNQFYQESWGSVCILLLVLVIGTSVPTISCTDADVEILVIKDRSIELKSIVLYQKKALWYHDCVVQSKHGSELPTHGNRREALTSSLWFPEGQKSQFPVQHDIPQRMCRPLLPRTHPYAWLAWWYAACVVSTASPLCGFRQVFNSLSVNFLVCKVGIAPPHTVLLQVSNSILHTNQEEQFLEQNRQPICIANFMDFSPPQNFW